VPLIKLTVFVDITQGGFVTGVLSREPVLLRQFGQADSIQWTITFVSVNPDAGYAAPYSALSATGLALKVAIGSPGQTPLCEEDSWAYGAPNGPNEVVGVLNLDTQAMRDQFTDPQVQYIEPWLEFQLQDADGVITPIHQQIFIFRQLLAPGTPPAPGPNQVFYDSSETDALYVKRIGKAGEGFFLQSADGTKSVFVYLDNDGSFHTDPATPAP
jgi:hypothetical protein